jgi:hypothetical protein
VWALCVVIGQLAVHTGRRPLMVTTVSIDTEHEREKSMKRTFMIALVVLAITLATGLGASGALFADVESEQHAVHAESNPSTLVEKVRQATDAFRLTIPDGYVQFLGCVSGPEEGAMGVHFVNFSLVDGKPEAEHPEALIYEVKTGRARLGGVEYIVPVDAWRPGEGEPPVPVLEGQVFHFVESPNRFGLPAFYELHVWAWRDNPNGTFADWNTRVSCDGQ